MRITPLDIRKQEFHKAMRGLDSEEVYAFLSTVGDEYETLLNDNKALRDRVLELDDKVQEYRSMEKTLRDTLLTAERVTVEAKDNARREANLIIKEAQMEAEKALRDIKNEAMKLHHEVRQLRSQREGYLARMRVVAESHIQYIEAVAADFSREEKIIESELPEKGRADTAVPSEREVTGANLFTPPAEAKEVPEETTGAAQTIPAFDPGQGDNADVGTENAAPESTVDTAAPGKVVEEPIDTEKIDTFSPPPFTPDPNLLRSAQDLADPPGGHGARNQHTGRYK